MVVMFSLLLLLLLLVDDVFFCVLLLFGESVCPSMFVKFVCGVACVLCIEIILWSAVVLYIRNDVVLQLSLLFPSFVAVFLKVLALCGFWLHFYPVEHQLFPKQTESCCVLPILSHLLLLTLILHTAHTHSIHIHTRYACSRHCFEGFV